MEDKLNNELCELKEHYRTPTIILFVLAIEVCVKTLLRQISI